MSMRIRNLQILSLMTTFLTLPFLYHHRHASPSPPLTTYPSYQRYFPPNPNFTHSFDDFLPAVVDRAREFTPIHGKVAIKYGVTVQPRLIASGYQHIDNPIHPFCPPMNGVKSACMSTVSNVYVNSLGVAIQPSTNTVYELSGGCCVHDWKLHLNTTQNLPKPSKRLDDKVVFVLNAHHSVTYHHVFHDVLPRYLMYLRFLEHQTHVLIGLTPGTLAKQLLQLSGISSNRFVFIEQWSYIPVALFPPSVFSHESFMYNDDIERGCAHLIAQAVPESILDQLFYTFSKPVLILLERALRRDSNGECREQRCATNFHHLKFQLEQAFKGVLNVMIYPASASVKHAVRMFRHARMVVGVHGGGFQNIMFCKKGTVVVHVGWDQQYRDVADRFELKYYFSEMSELKRESRGVTLNVDRVVSDAVDAARKEGIFPAYK